MNAYLLGDLIFIGLWLFLYFVFPKLRRMQTIGSLLLLPFAILDVWFRPNYWSPPLLIKSIEPISLETAIYCFTAGGIASAVGAKMVGRKVVGKYKWTSIAYFMFFAFGLFAVFELINISNPMNNLTLAFFIIFIAITTIHPDMAKKGVLTAIVFALFTILAINLANVFFPGFVAEFWNLQKLLPTFLNTPSEEILFAAVLGALWTALPQVIFIDNTESN